MCEGARSCVCVRERVTLCTNPDLQSIHTNMRPLKSFKKHMALKTHIQQILALKRAHLCHNYKLIYKDHIAPKRAHVIYKNPDLKNIHKNIYGP